MAEGQIVPLQAEADFKSVVPLFFVLLLFGSVRGFFVCVFQGLLFLFVCFCFKVF